MVPVVQLVRTPGCDSGGRGFETLRAPHFEKKLKNVLNIIFNTFFLCLDDKNI